MMQQNPLLHFVAFGMVFITTVLHSVVLGRVHVCKANLNCDCCYCYFPLFKFNLVQTFIVVLFQRLKADSFC